MTKTTEPRARRPSQASNSSRSSGRTTYRCSSACPPHPLRGLEGVAKARAILAAQAARRRQEAAEAAHLAPPHAA